MHSLSWSEEEKFLDRISFFLEHREVGDIAIKTLPS
jgi:hypothetical protein